MLSAGAITSISCILHQVPIRDALLRVLIVLIVFYFIGSIAGKYISRINKAANDAYIQAEREKMKAKKEQEQEKEQVEEANKEPSDSTKEANGQKKTNAETNGNKLT